MAFWKDLLKLAQSSKVCNCVHERWGCEGLLVPFSSWADEDGGGGHLTQVPGGAGVADKQTRQSLDQSNWVNKAARWRDGFGNPCTRPIHLGQRSRAADTHQGRHSVGRGTHPGVEGPVVLNPASPFIQGASTLAMVPCARHDSDRLS